MKPNKFSKRSALDLWSGRRQKPLVSGKTRLNPKDMTLGQQLIHRERVAKMRAEKEVSNRESIMPHITRHMSLGPDPKPLRSAKPQDTIFRPLNAEADTPPTVTARNAEDLSGGARVSRKEMTKRKRTTPKRKLVPGKDQ